MLLHGTIGHEAYLRPDGSVWIYHDRGGEAVNEWVWSQATGVERIGALVIASERISELKRLLPTRSADARDCGRCGGTGHIVYNVICPECGGLGWFGAAI